MSTTYNDDPSGRWSDQEIEAADAKRDERKGEDAIAAHRLDCPACKAEFALSYKDDRMEVFICSECEALFDVEHDANFDGEMYADKSTPGARFYLDPYDKPERNYADEADEGRAREQGWDG